MNITEIILILACNFFIENQYDIDNTVLGEPPIYIRVFKTYDNRSYSIIVPKHKMYITYTHSEFIEVCKNTEYLIL